MRKEIATAVKESLTRPHDKNCSIVDQEMSLLNKKCDDFCTFVLTFGVTPATKEQISQLHAMAKELESSVNRITQALNKDKTRIRKILDLQIEALTAGKLNDNTVHDLFDNQA